jgi:hypothetical protein
MIISTYFENYVIMVINKFYTDFMLLNHPKIIFIQRYCPVIKSNMIYDDLIHKSWQ